MFLLFKKRLTNFYTINNIELKPTVKFIINFYILFIALVVVFSVQNGRDTYKEYTYYYSYDCLQIIKHAENLHTHYFTSEYDILEKNYVIKEPYSRDLDHYSITVNFGTSEICQNLGERYLEYREFSQAHYNNIKENNKQLQLLRKDIENLKKEYPLLLQEKQANLPEDKSILQSSWSSAKVKLQKLEESARALENQNENIEEILRSSSSYENLKTYANSNLQDLQKLIKKRKFYRDAMQFGYSVLFLGGLFLISHYIYKYLYKKEYYLFSQMVLYVTYISSLYLGLYFFIFIYDIIPKYLLQNIIAFLFTYDLMFLLYYGGIFISILFFVLIVHYLQKKKKDQKIGFKNSKIDLELNRCPYCELKNGDNMIYCQLCGNKIMVICSNCKKLIKESASYCCYCGTRKDKAKTKNI